MPLRALCCLILVPFWFWLSGCAPTAEGQADDQKNPYYLAGKEKLSALDYKGAIESFERALEDYPRSALTHFELGVLYDQQERDYASALYHYNRALKLRPTGYPADNIRQRIPACRQELVKADSLATVNPNLLGEIQALHATNQWLMKELELARARLAGRTLSPTASDGAGRSGPGSRDAAGATLASSYGSAPPGARASQGSASRATGPSPANASRTATDSGRRVTTYAVKAGDTAASIARRYGVRLDSLLAVNPGLDPKRMRVGQSINVPAS